MISVFKENKVFFTIYLLTLSLATPYFFLHPHGSFVLWINQHSTIFLDYFFKYWTYTGDGWMFAVIVLINIIKKKKYLALSFVFIGLANAAISAFLKRIVFTNMPRPMTFFNNIYDPHLVEGVTMLHYNSFPSGHTITAFSLATFLALINRNKKYMAFLLCLYAILSGMSRIYLFQHFLIDVIVGSFLGSVIAIIFYYLFKNTFTKMIN